MKHLLIIGSGGHAKVVIDACELLPHEIRVVGLIDDYRKDMGEKTSGYDILGAVEDIPSVVKKFDVTHLFIAVGDNYSREKIYDKVKVRLPYTTIIHPSAVLSKAATILDGCLVLAGCVVNSGTTIGSHCILNTGSIIEHDCLVGSFSSLAPRAVVGGKCTINSGVAIGIGATVTNDVNIGTNTVIGAGSVVLKAIPDNVVAYGSPCRSIHPRNSYDPYM